MSEWNALNLRAASKSFYNTPVAFTSQEGSEEIKLNLLISLGKCGNCSMRYSSFTIFIAVRFFVWFYLDYRNVVGEEMREQKPIVVINPNQFPVGILNEKSCFLKRPLFVTRWMDIALLGVVNQADDHSVRAFFMRFWMTVLKMDFPGFRAIV